MNHKQVDEKTFKECCDLMLTGRMHPDVCAYLTGLSRPTFRLRVNQFYDPERYGELPEGFFGVRTHKWKENTGWVKESAAVRDYLKREKERTERNLVKEESLRREKKRDKFLDASKLPRLED